MKTDVTYLYLEEIFITSISVLQTVVCFHFGFCIHLIQLAILIIHFSSILKKCILEKSLLSFFSVQLIELIGTQLSAINTISIQLEIQKDQK